MRLIELESSAVAQDLAGSLARAHQEVPEAEQRFKQAEANLAKATTARLHAQKRFGQLTSQAALLLEKQRAAKRRALESSAMELPDRRAHAEYVSTKAEREFAIDSLSFVALYVEPDAARALLVAELAHDEAYCDMMEAKVALQRLGLARELGKINDLDPGVRLAFSLENPDGVSERSWSETVIQQVKAIRGKFPEMRSRIVQHDRTVQSQRELSGESLFS